MIKFLLDNWLIINLLLNPSKTHTKPPHLVAYHDVGDFGLAVYVLVLLLVGENREDKVARFALTLPHQEAASFAFFREQLLRISSGQVPMIPPGGGKWGGSRGGVTV